MSNAVKFTPKGGRVDVMLRRVASSFEIEVRDTGQGMEPDLLPRVFDRFHQGDSSPSRPFAGLGLGLSIVRYIVEAHGGTVRASSAGTGQGSSFSVRVPIRAVRAAATAAADAAEGAADDDGEAEVAQSYARLDGVRVLVVVDDPDARQILRLVLEQTGAIVTTAASAPEALGRLARGRFNVLVSDLGMPEQDGFDLIRQVRALGHSATDLPAVALTAFVQADDARSAMLAGFQLHLPKPVDPLELTRAISDLAEPALGGRPH